MKICVLIQIMNKGAIGLAFLYFLDREEVCECFIKYGKSSKKGGRLFFKVIRCNP